LWQGFAYQPIKGDWSLLQEHILHNICDGNMLLHDWLLNWMALGVQQPSYIIGTAPVFQGLPGTGKGIVANSFGMLWGAHFTTVTHPDHVAGRFNAHLFAKRFVFIDEGTAATNEREAGVIKNRITEPTIILEHKGVDPIKLKNRMIFMVASNSQSVVAADLNERRWTIFEVGDAVRENHDYFQALVQQLEAGGYHAMLHDLLHRDLSKGPNPRRILKTEALFHQIILSRPPEVQYVYGVLDEGRLPESDATGTATTIHALFEDMSRKHRGKLPALNALGRFLKKVLPDVRTRQVKISHYYAGGGTLPVENSTEYAFPNLARCRVAFEKYIGITVPWVPDVKEWITPKPPPEHF
jgi:hypothetical protein